MQIQDVARIEGRLLDLRLIEEDDAGYVFGLRTDRRYNAFLSPVSGAAEDQRRWIERYKQREARLEELYYVIERKDGTRCGLVRLYEIGDRTFTWGSWLLDEDKPPKAALESAVLSFGVGFEKLGLERALLDVRIDNEKAISIYRRFGMEETGRDDENLYFAYDRDRFEANRAAHLDILNGETQQ